MRIESASPETGTVVTVIDRTTMTSYNPGRQTLTRVHAQQGMDRPVRNASDLLRKDRNQRIDLLGTETLNDRPCYHLTFAEELPTTGTAMLQHLWIDRETWLWVRMEQYNAAGRLAYRLETEFLAINEGLPDDLFVLEAPPGTTVQEETVPELFGHPKDVDLAQALEILEGCLLVLPPPEEEEGLELQKIHRFRGRAGDYVTLVYRKSGQSLTYLVLRERPEKGSPETAPVADAQRVALPWGEEGSYRRIGAGPLPGMLSFRRNGLEVTLAGPEDPMELAGWAGRLEPVSSPSPSPDC